MEMIQKMTMGVEFPEYSGRMWADGHGQTRDFPSAVSLREGRTVPVMTGDKISGFLPEDLLPAILSREESGVVHWEKAEVNSMYGFSGEKM